MDGSGDRSPWAVRMGTSTSFSGAVASATSSNASVGPHELLSVDALRSFAGTLLREGLPGAAGIFVTLSDFTEQARAEARTIGITLVNNRDLNGRIQNARRVEPCPICQAAMVLDRSGRGWWLRCVAPGCSGKHDLSGDPGRAVEFLTRPA